MRQRAVKVLFCLLLFLLPLRGVWSQSTSSQSTSSQSASSQSTSSQSTKTSAVLNAQFKRVEGKAGEDKKLALEAGLKTLIAQNDSAAVNLWLEKYPDTNAYPASKTALIYAAAAGRIDIVSELIRWDKDGAQPSCQETSTDCIEYLNRCEIFSSEVRGYNALMYASENGHTEIVNYLLNAGADATKKCQFGQFTALQIAQNAGKVETASVLEKKLATEQKRADEEKKQANESVVWLPLLQSNSSLIGWVLGIIGLGMVLYRREDKDPFLLFVFLIVGAGGVICVINWWLGR